MAHDDYETLWRARATEHGLRDVDWYIYTKAGVPERYTDLAEAERKTLEYHGEPNCGRGASCADIAPFLGGRRGDYLAAVEALLDGLYDDEEA